MNLIRSNDLGRTGLLVSELCLSTLNFGWRIRPEEAPRLLDRFHEDGGNFLLAAGLCPGAASRHSWTEAPERCVGRWWRTRGLARENLVLATKLIVPSSARVDSAEIEACLLASLERLETDRVDLLVFDFPADSPAVAGKIEAVARFVDKGLVGHIAVGGLSSRHPSEGMPERRWSALSCDYSLLERGAERLFEGRSRPLPGFVAQSPLAGGFLALREGGGSSHETRHRRHLFATRGGTRAEEIRATLATVAEECEATLAQVAISWVLSNPAVSSVVVSALSPDQLIDSIGACTLDLSWSQLRRLDLASSRPAAATEALAGAG